MTNRLNQLLALASLFFGVQQAVAQGTAFTYFGRLSDANTGNPITANQDMQFALFDNLTAGSQVGSTITILSVPFHNGLFKVTLDFGTGRRG
jgi:hypothetical protein